MDEYRPASFRDLFVLLASVIAGVVLIWLVLAWGVPLLGGSGPSPVPNPPYVPGVIPGN